jgi:membrane associated rhomboid family serine protease
MAEISADPLETILRQIAAAAPEPWYPKLHAEASGVQRDSLDAPLEKLRLANLIRLTEWVQGRGQGYVLTPEGMHAINDGRALIRVREGKVAPRAAPVAPMKRPRWSAWDRGEEIREVLLNPPNAVVAKTILLVNVLLFLAAMYAAARATEPVPVNLYLYGSVNTERQAETIYTVKHAFGAVTGHDLAAGQWWRLLTYGFVHHGLLHIVLNMWALFALSKYLEPMWGHVRFLIVYLIAGWGGGCVAMAVKPVSFLGGASGSLCGVIAAEAVWLVLNRAHLPAQLFAAWIRNIGINAVLIVIISTLPNVSAAGHFGGAAAGAAVAVLLHFQRYGSGVVRWLAPVGVILVPIIATGALVYTMRTSPTWQQVAAEVRDREALREYQNLRDRFRSGVAPVLEDAQSAYRTAFAEVLQSNPIRRNVDKKQQAIEDLVKARADLRTALGSFEAGPIANDSRNADARNVVVELIKAEELLCGMAEDYLENDVNVLNNAKSALEAQEEVVRKLEQLCRRNGLFPST